MGLPTIAVAVVTAIEYAPPVEYFVHDPELIGIKAEASITGLPSEEFPQAV